MSKKIISIMLAVIMLVSAMCISVSAATGKAGDYYYTDIKSYVRGQLIDSYNIGGTTVILVESLRTYGFNVDWNPDARTLTITDFKGAATSSATPTATGAIGAVAGSYYHTDIVTYFNGVAIESYNLGGQTVIPATKLRDFGYNVVWDADNRRVLIETDPTQLASIPAASVSSFDNVTVKAEQIYHGTTKLIANSITFNGWTLVTSNDCYIETSLDKKNYIPFRAVADCLGITYGWDSASSTIAVSVPSDNVIKPANQKIKSNYKTFGTIEYEIQDIVLNIRNGEELHSDVDAVLYGSEIFVEAKDLAEALNFFCVNQVDFYTETMMYMVYSGMVNPY
ncbi:MAG: hypothetical protein IKV86_02940 [Clostridia bacterium]|nr:hypothetical protein [Clostridia bacterium]